MLVPFVNNHHSTLQSLELSFEVYGQSKSFTWFSGIRDFPHSVKLTFYSHFATTPLTDYVHSVLWYILTICSGGLRELYVALSRLESIHIILDRFSDAIRTITLLRHCRNTLTTLKLKGRRLTYDEVEMSIHAFAGRDVLRVLHLEVDHLGPVISTCSRQSF
jgi:hypothetical protein